MVERPEGLKALSARVVRAAPNEEIAILMRAVVLSGASGFAWEAGRRSAAELKEAAAHYERAAALSKTPMLRLLKLPALISRPGAAGSAAKPPSARSRREVAEASRKRVRCVRSIVICV